MELPKPPQDVELRNIIDKLAQFVARNGPEFEQMTKNKQKGNPKFGFLFGGEYFNYYQYKVTTEQAILKLKDGRGGDSNPPPPTPPQAPPAPNITATSLSSMLMNAVQGISQQAGSPMTSMPSLNNPAQAGLVAQWIVQHTQQQVQQQTQVHQPPLPPLPSGPPTTIESLTQQQNVLHEQINQSEQNLNAQHLVLVHHEDAQIEQEIRKSEMEKLQREAEELGISLSDFDSVLQPIMDSCTKDSISNGKTWLLNRATCKAINDLLARYLLFKVLDEPEKKFFRKLHVIYLVNDILHHCVRKHIEGFKIALEEVVVPMFVNASLGVTEDQQTKLNKLLMIWEKKNHYFPDEIVSQLKDPENSWERYKQQRLQDHSDIVDGIKLNTKNAVSTFQSQHLAFVTHAQQQIQALEQQKQNLIDLQQKSVQAISPALPPEPKLSLSSISRPPPPFEREDDTSDSDMRDRSRHDLDGSPVSRDRPPDGPRSDSRHDQGRGMDRNSLPMDDHLPDRLHDFRDHRGPPQDFRGSMDPFDMPPDHRFEPRFDSRHDGPPSIGGPPGGAPLPTLPLELPINLNQPPPGFAGPPPDILLPDLTRPPPGFPPVPENPFQPEDLLPSLPYFDLPAGLMVPLIRLEDYNYKPLDPDSIRLPPPAPPSERLLAAVKAFYMPPRHENPRDSDGWEKLGLYEYFRAKAAAKKQKELEIDQGIRPRSRSPTPVRSWQDQAKSPPPKRRYSSRSRSKSREREKDRERDRSSKRRERSRRDRSRSPEQPRPERRERDRDRDRGDREDRDRGDRDRDRDERDRDRDHDDSRDSSREARSPTPPSFMGGGGGYGNPNSEDRLGESNKGHQLLKKMGWGGAGLGAKEQGIEQPISGGDVRDRQDQYKGVGINLNDPYENFRKSKGQAFINRMKARAEERAS
uniref:Calcium homeostasis endoplasmic reticulum protein n=3 Tax=Lygus hesperus TaxID=30085 RepID=A0A146KXF5_LYGHE